MASMTIRTTVAFDPATVARWERLAKLWGVSKSEALRRALAVVEEANFPPPAQAPSDERSLPSSDQIERMSPQQAFECLQAHSLVTPEAGNQWRQEICETRKEFARRP